MKKLFRELKSKLMHWHRWSPRLYSSGVWEVFCKCGERVSGLTEQQSKITAWKSNVTSGNAKANYVNNGKIVKS